jgi:hypothetical protein
MTTTTRRLGSLAVVALIGAACSSKDTVLRARDGAVDQSTTGAGGTSPGTGGAGGAAGSGSGGQGTPDAADAKTSADAQALAELCTTSGGQPSSQVCCNSVGDYPNTCLVGACSCAPSSGHTVAVCACPAGGCFSPTTGCTSSGSGGGGGGKGGAGGTAGATGADAGRGGSSGTGGASGKGGATGAGGATGSDGGGNDVPIGTDATAAAELCTATGGTISSGQCCTSVGDFPSMCLVGACGCPPSGSHTVELCSCPTGTCFSPGTGCGPT